MQVAIICGKWRQRIFVPFTPEKFLEIGEKIKEAKPVDGYYEEWKKVGNEYRIYIRRVSDNSETS